MEAVAPVSVLLVGLVGVLVVLAAVVRIAVAERRLVAARVTHLSVSGKLEVCYQSFLSSQAP